eukprot:scaffold5708_cov378-Prasinococcus_capsulatus_cf.AAC.3
MGAAPPPPALPQGKNGGGVRAGGKSTRAAGTEGERGRRTRPRSTARVGERPPRPAQAVGATGELPPSAYGPPS